MRCDIHKASDTTGKDFANMHWWSTLDFGGDNVITVKCNGKNYQTETHSS
jgi:hypothetical protein